MNISPAGILPSSPPTLPDFYQVVEEEFSAVDRLIREQTTSDVELVEVIGRHITSAGGKRLRPLLVLLTHGACGKRPDANSIMLAAVIELLHTATLLHDDVVDHAHLRRGTKTVNAIWDNASSVLVGDFLYSRAFQLMVRLGNTEVTRIISDTTNLIAEGEVMQLSTAHCLELSEARYMEIIHRKTAALFRASSHTAAVAAGASAGQQQAMHEYGTQLGLAFQLTDDALDYSGEAEQTGKAPGNDLAEGKVTLPLIHALAEDAGGLVAKVRAAMDAGNNDCLEEVRSKVCSGSSLGYTLARAEKHAGCARQSLLQLPAGKYRDALDALVQFSTMRSR